MKIKYGQGFKAIRITADIKSSIMEALALLSHTTRFDSITKGKDSIGFNRYDQEIGQYLASRIELTDKEALTAYRILKKYKGQIGELWERIYGDN